MLDNLHLLKMYLGSIGFEPESIRSLSSLYPMTTAKGPGNFIFACFILVEGILLEAF